MFCPECGAEFREGIEECFDCEIPLQPDPPAEPTVPKYVTVLETSELAVIPILKTALESADIPYRTRGESLMNILPANTHSAPLHASGGEVKIRVPEDRAEEARALLTTAPTLEADPDDEIDGETAGDA